MSNLKTFFYILWVLSASFSIKAGTLLPVPPTFSNTGKVVFVSQNASGLNTGDSWADAFTDFSAALSAALDGDTLWVAAGTYYPDSAGGDVYSHFVLDKSLVILGGFAGTEVKASERNPDANPTILSGDLQGDDVPGDLELNKTDNVFTILLINPVSGPTPKLDGLVFQGGFADGNDADFSFRRGGGVFSFGTVQIENCLFQDNYARADGAAAYFMSPSVNGSIIRKSAFNNNRAGEDGGACMIFEAGTATVKLDSCHFEGNVASRRGGALCLLKSSVDIESSLFTGNTCTRNGGAISAIGQDADSLRLHIVNTVFNGNAGLSGGAIHFLGNAYFGLFDNRINLNNCTFIGNQSMDMGPGNNPRGGALELLFNQQSNLGGIFINGCLFSSNTSEGEGGAAYVRLGGQGTRLAVEQTIFVGNEALQGGSFYVSGESVGNTETTFKACNFIDNMASEIGGALVTEGKENTEMEVEFTDVLFQENESLMDGGALAALTNDGGELRLNLSICTFLLNSAGQEGGAVLALANNPSLRVRIRRTEFYRNSAGEGSVLSGKPAPGISPEPGASFVFENSILHRNMGGGAVLSATDFKGMQLLHCTVAYNDGAALGLDEGSQLLLQNNLFYNPGFPELAPAGDLFSITSFGGNLFGDNTLEDFVHAFDQESTIPEFMDTLTLQLGETSPAIDAGIFSLGLPTIDFAGEARIQGSCVDIGALESSYDSGTDCQQVVSTKEISVASSTVFPNPASERLEIVPGVALGSAWKVRVSTLSGQEVVCPVERYHAGSGERYRLNVSDLKAGLYLVSGHGTQGQWTVRFVKSGLPVSQ